MMHMHEHTHSVHARLEACLGRGQRSGNPPSTELTWGVKGAVWWSGSMCCQPVARTPLRHHGYVGTM